jgi:putative SOS response-associated peptidase YedK
MDAFYEWHGPKQSRVPFAAARHDRGTFAVAALWESWVTPGTGKVLRTFALVTVGANATMAAVHDRMPAIIARDDWPLWLGEVSGDPYPLLQPAPDDRLETWPVATKVNKVENNGPDLLAPASDLAPG